MRFTIWGARGSYPVPLSPSAVRAKLAAILQRVKPSDVESADTRKDFLASLPTWLYGTTGGNTSCVQLLISNNQNLLFDAGSGIINFARTQLVKSSAPKEYHIFLTHFHYDHIQGFPFFVPAYIPDIEVHIYSPVENVKDIMAGQMKHPYFPVTMLNRMPNLHFHRLDSNPIEIYGARITARAINHPGGAFAYRVQYQDKAFAYITDVELLEADFQQTEDNIQFFQNLDTAILDTQYTLGEAIEKYNWGHSSFSLGVEFCNTWNIKKLYMFHHEPLYDDIKLRQNLDSARLYARKMGNNTLKIFLASEGIIADV